MLLSLLRKKAPEAEEELQQQEALLFAAQHSKHQRRRKEEVRIGGMPHQGSCGISEPRGLEWFLPGAARRMVQGSRHWPEMVVCRQAASKWFIAGRTGALEH